MGRQAENTTAMLTNISWPEFLLIAGTALILYYLVILLLYFRQDIRHQLTRIFHRAGLQADRPSLPQESILGPVSPEPGPSLSSAHELQVGPAARTAPQQPERPPALEDTASLLQSAAATRMGKEEFLALLGLLLERHLPDQQQREALQLYLLEHGAGQLAFPLTAADLSDL